MCIVMTLLIRDEEDIIATNIDFHLSQGVDMIIVTDNLSVDNTNEILKKYQRKGVVKIIEETSDDYSQHKWVTRMARMAVTDYNATWVINSDADEFWMPDDRSQNIKQVLADIPENVLAGKAQRVNFLPPLGAEENIFFAKSMTIREVQSYNAIGQPLPPKTCHRGIHNITIKQGNHHVEKNGIRLIPAEMPITILHFPLRSFAQFENKIKKGGAAYERNSALDKRIGSTWRNLYKKYLDGTLFEYYLKQRPDNKTISSGFEMNKFVCDKRITDFTMQNEFTASSTPKGQEQNG